MEHSVENLWLGPMCAFLAALTWAFGSAGYGRLSRKFSPFAINLARASVALPLSILVVFWERGQGLVQTVQWVQAKWLLVSVLSSYGLADALFFLSIRSLGLPSSLAIASTYPLWSALVAWLWRHEALAPQAMGGLLAVVGGTVMVILSQPRSTDSNPEESRGRDHPRWGVLLALATSLLWAINASSIAQVGTQLSTAMLSMVRMAWAVVICGLLGGILNGPRSLWIGRTVFRRHLPLFVIESFAGSFFFSYGLSHAPLGMATALSSLSPVIAVPIAWVAGWERPSWLRLCGVLAVVVGVVLLLVSF